MALQIGLLIAYPILTHLAVSLGQPALLLLAIISLATGLLHRGILQRNKIALGLWLGTICIGLLLHLYSNPIYLLYVPPIALPLLLLGVFGSTLLPGKIPLVTDIGEKARGPLSPQMRNYTLRVTQLWALMFAALATSSALLAWLASDQIWSLATSVVNHVITGTLFVGEFIFRKIKFRDHDHPTFIEYIRIVTSSEIYKNKHV